MEYKYVITLLLMGTSYFVQAQEKPKPEDTDVWEPIPEVVTINKGVPSDAVILNIDQWVLTSDHTKPADWLVNDGIITVSKHSGNIETKQSFNNYQLHIEWRIPENITGDGQGRGNSGVFLASLGKGNAGYELQILDSYGNKTYVNGMAGSLYKQFIPLKNPSLKPGEWQMYDVIWMAPVFNKDGSLQSPARATVLFNGVLVQNNAALTGPTLNAGKPAYNKPHGPSPIKLQAHGDKSEPISFRNIWVREL
jgi:hypothetical protein